MLGVDGAGVAATSNGPGEAYGGPLPSGAVRDLRRLLCRAFHGGGFSADQVGEPTGMSRSSVATPEAEADATMPPDEPPGISPPEPRPAPAFVELSARFVAGLRRDYGRDVATDEGRKIGDLAEVAEWVDSLKPGRFKPAR